VVGNDGTMCQLEEILKKLINVRVMQDFGQGVKMRRNRIPAGWREKWYPPVLQSKNMAN